MFNYKCSILNSDCTFNSVYYITSNTIQECYSSLISLLEKDSIDVLDVFLNIQPTSKFENNRTNKDVKIIMNKVGTVDI